VIAHAGSIPRLAIRTGWVLTATLLVIAAAAAWWRTIADAREMSSMLDGFVKVGRAMAWDISPVGFAGTWAVMMAAMMLPGVVPVVMASRRDELPSPLARVAWVVGYLGVWVATGAIAFGALLGLNEMDQPSPWLHRVGGALIVLAGTYQFTGWKRRLLERNRDQILSGRNVFGGVFGGGFAAGLSHGVRCVGASWALMSVLLVVGVMNVAWMAAVSAVCLGEKAWTRRAALATVVGVVLVVVGLVALIEPRTLGVIAGTG
jgi:predicted metal-binding membrane protein